MFFWGGDESMEGGQNDGVWEVHIKGIINEMKENVVFVS